MRNILIFALSTVWVTSCLAKSDVLVQGDQSNPLVDKKGYAKFKTFELSQGSVEPTNDLSLGYNLRPGTLRTGKRIVDYYIQTIPVCKFVGCRLEDTKVFYGENKSVYLIFENLIIRNGSNHQLSYGSKTIVENKLLLEGELCSEPTSYCYMSASPVSQLSPSSIYGYRSEYCSEELEQCVLSHVLVDNESRLEVQGTAILGLKSQILIRGGRVVFAEGSHFHIQYDSAIDYPRIIMDDLNRDHMIAEGLGGTVCAKLETDKASIQFYSSNGSWAPPGTSISLLAYNPLEKCRQIPDFTIQPTLTSQWLLETETSWLTSQVQVKAVRIYKENMYSIAASDELKSHALIIDTEIRQAALSDLNSKAAKLLSHLDTITDQEEYDQAIISTIDQWHNQPKLE